MKKSEKISNIAWLISLSPYIVALLFALFGAITVGQAVFYGFAVQLVCIGLVFVFRYPLIALFSVLFAFNS